MDRKVIHRGARVSWEQQQGLMEYMQAHEDLARAKISGPDAFRVKKAMLEELSINLNAMDSGATKTPEKWYKCWTDWKCDVRAKALRIKQCRLSTVSGFAPPQLTALEKLVLQYCGEETVQGLTVMDPLDESSSNPGLLSAIDEKPDESPLVDAELDQSWPHTGPRPGAGRNQSNYSLIDGLQRQAAAIEKLGSGLHKMAAGVATSVKSVSTALMAIAAAIETQPEISHQTYNENDDAQSSSDVQDAKPASKDYQENHEVTRRKRRRTVLTSADRKTTSNTKCLQNYQSYDATEQIFLGYAKSIKALSIRRQARIKMKIAQIIVEEEVAQVEENSPQHSDNAPPSPYAIVKMENSNDSSHDGF